MKKRYTYFISANIVIGKNSFFREIIYHTDTKITSVETYDKETRALKKDVTQKMPGAQIVILNFKLLSEELTEVNVNNSETFGVL